MSFTSQTWQELYPGWQDQLEEFIRGVRTYKKASQTKPRACPPVVWSQGSTKLYDYGVYGDTDGPAVLVIPSQVNRSYILDLESDFSLLRYWANHGVRPYLLDWGDLSEDEREYSLDDYYYDRLEPIYQFLKAASTSPVAVAGYCMGGVMATALAAHHPEISGLVLLATPWDFHVEREWIAWAMEQSAGFFENIIDVYQELPIEVIQMMFASLNPPGALKKFTELGKQFQDTEFVSNFVQVEEWLNDYVPLAPKVAKQCLLGWYRDNEPYRGQWSIRGKRIQPNQIRIPTLGVIPQKDTVVPPASSRSLMFELQNAQYVQPHLGHIGLVTSRSAPESVWEPTVQFLNSITTQ